MNNTEMHALVKAKAAEGLWMQSAPVPTIGTKDVLIRINKTGICGTDVHIWKWDEWASKTVPVPLIIGHEFAGEIVELDSQVADVVPVNVAREDLENVCARLGLSQGFDVGLEMSKVITHRYPAQEFETGFATMMGGSSGKVVLDWTDI